MFAFVKGEVADLMEGIVIVENNGIGYEILVPSDVVSEVTIGMEVKLHTYFHVKEDAMTLFGFLSREDLNIFKKLITVNSVGPKSALAIMSTLTTSDLIMAIISGDSKAISKAPGVGSKSAQKIILELKDKFDNEDILGTAAGFSDGGAQASANNSAVNDAVETLVALGYGKSQALKAVSSVEIKDSYEAGDIVSLALKNIK